MRLREALEARLEGSRLTTRVGWLDFPETDLPSVTRLLDGETRTAGELGVDTRRETAARGRTGARRTVTAPR